MYTKPHSLAANIETAVSNLRSMFRELYLMHGDIGVCSRAAVPLHHLTRALDHLPADLANGRGHHCARCPHRETDVVHQPLDNASPNRLEAVCGLPRGELTSCPILRAVGYGEDGDVVPGYLARQAD